MPGMCEEGGEVGCVYNIICTCVDLSVCLLAP